MTTFVTAIIDLEEKRINEKTYDRYFELFELLAKTGINIAVYGSNNFKQRLEDTTKIYSNVKIAKIMDLSDTWTYDTVTKVNINLPHIRNITKDTKNFMITMNSKIEYMKDAIIQNIFDSTHFAWIDFGIFHVFKNKQATIEKLIKIGSGKFPDKILVFPGCWPKYAMVETITNSIHWRFCGGFFLGDKSSLLSMWNLYRDILPTFISLYKTIVWEVNIWTYMETHCDWQPDWYKGDHDDSIIDIPNHYFLQ